MGALIILYNDRITLLLSRSIRYVILATKLNKGDGMPNKAAKLRKQERRKKNLFLSTNGRTANQITRNIERNNKRKGKG